MLATELDLNISHLILLGTPIRTEYTPNLKRVWTVNNVYVPWDIVQTAGSLPYRRGEGRALADTNKLFNRPIQNRIGGIKQSHSDLHDWKVWIDPANRLDQMLWKF